MKQFKKSDYAKSLLDPRWQRKRLEILQRDQFACQSCQDDTKTLHVHHKVYVENKEPWEYDKVFLITLCKDCHEAEKAEMEAAVKNLVFYFKKHFLASQVETIAAAMDSFIHVHHPDVTSDAIAHFLSHPNLVYQVCEIVVEKHSDTLDL